MKKYFADQSGATAVEYCLIAGAMTAMLVAAFPAITNAVSSKYATIGASFGK
jgi:pilus assembly protein Flp/PilA